MNQTILYLIWLISVVMIHELGHYIAYRAYGIKPKITLKWWGIQIGEEKDFWRLTPLQSYIIAGAGIIAGLIFTLFFLSAQFLLYVYLAMCIVDFIMIFVSLKHFTGDNPINEYQYQELLESRKKYYREGD